MSSNFRKVCDFNISFGLAHFDSPQETILKDNKALSQLRLSLCKEEIEELNDAFEQKNFIEVIDALTDELYVLYGAGSSFGVNLDDLFKTKLNEIYSFNSESDVSNFNALKTCVNNESKLLVSLPDTIQQNIFEGPISYHIIYLLQKINNEITKLETSIKEEKFTASINYIVTLLIYIYRMGLYLGIDLDRSFTIVHNSNMSKLCISEIQAQNTVEWYKENEKRYDTPEYRKSDNGKYWVVFNKSTGKILKNKDYTPADFKIML